MEKEYCDKILNKYRCDQKFNHIVDKITLYFIKSETSKIDMIEICDTVKIVAAKAIDDNNIFSLKLPDHLLKEEK